VVTLVVLDPTDGLPHVGQDVTLEVSTTTTTRPFVALNCSQHGALVYSNSVGLFDDYPQQNVMLASSMWTGGAADCTATAYYFTNNGAERVIGTKNFGVLG
jgi:hypothetical protein